ncbi:MAG: rRNA (cytosine967-C5)-methyltransferase [Betaproteobacteria bacterium]|nr:rRNA (cytosine967-C5)-methyltransferase [Betaproteobacteria bacterium]
MNVATRPTPALLAHAVAAASETLRFSGPADETLSRYFRSHRALGQQERGFVAEAVFAVLRRKRSLEAAAGSTQPRLLVAAALVRVLGFSGRALSGLLDDELIARLRAASSEAMPVAVRAELPDWLWQRLASAHGEAEALRMAQALANPAPLDLRVNLARSSRDDALARLVADGIEASATPYSPAGIRLVGKPPINRHALFKDGLIEVQDEGSQLIAWLLGPRRGEMIADYCAGAGGKTLAAAALMRGSGRIYAFDTSPKRLAALAPRAARAGITNVHAIVLAAGQDARVRRLAGKLDRVLVDAPCSGFGTLRRNPELKWRYGEQAITELVEKQGRILAAASRLVKPGGRLVYATCSLLQEENEAVAAALTAAQPEFQPVSSAKLLAAQRIELDTGENLKLSPHRHSTDAFFAAVFERRKL